MNHADAPKPELSSPALSQQIGIGGNSMSSMPSLEKAHDAIDLYTSTHDQPQGRAQAYADSRSPVVRTEIRLGSLDVSESLSRLAEVLKIDVPQADTSGNETNENESDWDIQRNQSDGLAPATEHPAQVANQIADVATGSLSNLLLEDGEARSPIHDLHQQNQDVLDQILQLETLLADYQAILSAQPQQLASSSTSSSINSPISVLSAASTVPNLESHGDMTAAQTQALQLMTELEVANQVSQHQQSLIELLAAELQASRSQLADLEQQYIQARQQAEEKTKLLSDQEVTCSDLRSRLHRQQRYTLQFKAALEKCLEMSSASADGELPIDALQDDLDSIVITPPDSADQETATLRSQIFLPKMKPIQPWSQSPALFGEEIAAEPERHPVDGDQNGNPDQDVHGSEWLWFVNDGDEPPINQESSIFATVTPIEVDSVSAPSPLASSALLSEAIGHTALSDAGVIDVASEALEKPVGSLPSISFDLRRRKSSSGEEESLSTPSLPGVPPQLERENSSSTISDLASLEPVIAELASLEHELAAIHRAIDTLAAEPEEMPIVDASHTLAANPEATNPEATNREAANPEATNPDGADLNRDVTLPHPVKSRTEPEPNGGLSLEVLAALTPHHNLEVDIWEDLARVINAPSAVTIVNSSLLQMRGLSTNPVPTAAEQSAPAIESTPSLEQALQPATQQPDTMPASPPSALPLSDGLATSETNNNETTHEQPILAEPAGQNGVYAETPFQIHPTWPSPTVYADRPLKKRTSLAAVELPSFPRLRQQ